MKNAEIHIHETEILSDHHYLLKKVDFEMKQQDGKFHRMSREVYDRGNASAILLYNIPKKTIVLTEQFRLPTYLNGNESGYLIEACAGVLDGDTPEVCAIRETQEETGYTVKNPTHVFDVYMSPGTVTELMSFFIVDYHDLSKTSAGGGLAEESEDIHVIEMQFSEAMESVKNGTIRDAKTIILLQHLKIIGLMD